MDTIDEGYIQAMMPKPRALGHSVPVSGGRNLDRLPTLNTAETPVSKAGPIAVGPGTFDDGEARRDQGNDFNLLPQVRQEIRAYNETVIAAEVAGGSTYSVNPNLANIFHFTLAGNATVAFGTPDPVPADQGVAGDPRHRAHGVTVVVSRPSGVSPAFTGVSWAGGTPPEFDSSAAAIDCFVFLKLDTLGAWLGFPSGIGFT